MKPSLSVASRCGQRSRRQCHLPAESAHTMYSLQTCTTRQPCNCLCQQARDRMSVVWQLQAPHMHTPTPHCHRLECQQPHMQCMHVCMHTSYYVVHLMTDAVMYTGPAANESSQRHCSPPKPRPVPLTCPAAGICLACRGPGCQCTWQGTMPAQGRRRQSTGCVFGGGRSQSVWGINQGAIKQGVASGQR